MKAVNLIIKIVAALAAVAGIVYVVATYGDKIVAWAKKLLGCCTCDGECDCCECDCFEEGDIVADGSDVVEDGVDAVVENGEPVATDNDFEG